jgi:hypothetical protein
MKRSLFHDDITPKISYRTRENYESTAGIVEKIARYVQHVFLVFYLPKVGCAHNPVILGHLLRSQQDSGFRIQDSELRIFYSA